MCNGIAAAQHTEQPVHTQRDACEHTWGAKTPPSIIISHHSNSNTPSSAGAGHSVSGLEKARGFNDNLGDVCGSWKEPGERVPPLTSLLMSLDSSPWGLSFFKKFLFVFTFC